MTDTLRTFVLDEVNGMIDSLDETATHEDMGRVLLELRDAVRDGTWQPTPTAKPERWANGHRWPCTRFYTSATERDRCTCGSAAEPPRIEDMAPGTTFRACLDSRCGRGTHERHWFVTTSVAKKVTGYMVTSADGERWTARMIDPSTIRDVTPPKGDDRG